MMKRKANTTSMTNYLLSGTKGQPTPEVGMGITLLSWTDRSAGTIRRISPSGKTFWFSDDLATRTDTNGMSEMQEYRFETVDGPQRAAKKAKDGSWKEVGGGRIRLDSRSAYHDFSF